MKKEYSFSSIARNVGVSTNTIIRVFDTIQYPKVDLKNVKALGIDEFKGNTGGEKYNCIVTDVNTNRVLDILPKRSYPYLVNYVKNNKDKSKINYVVSDMWKPYYELFKTFLKMQHLW